MFVFISVRRYLLCWCVSDDPFSRGPVQVHWGHAGVWLLKPHYLITTGEQRNILMLCVNYNHSTLCCFSLANGLWSLNLFMYINVCISLTHFLSDTHTHSVSQPTPGTDKGSFMFAGLSWGQWVLVLRASFTRSEWSWRRNEKKPYISRCCRVKEVLLVYNSFLDSLLHYYRDTPLGIIPCPSIAQLSFEQEDG